MYLNLVMPGSAATQNTTVASGLQVGLGTRTAASEVIPVQGDFNQTGNALDLAIQGAGFSQVKMPNGETGYTRAGMFHLDNQGNVVTADGNGLDRGHHHSAGRAVGHHRGQRLPVAQRSG